MPYGRGPDNGPPEHAPALAPVERSGQTALVSRTEHDAGSMLQRSVNLLQAFRPDGRPLALTELAGRAGMPKSTAHRLAQELVDLRLLERQDGLYSVGLGVFELSGLVPVSRRLRETALPYMQDLFMATQQTVHLAIRDGYDVVYAEKIHGHDGLELPSHVGGRLPLTCTAVGKALLAYADPAFIQEVLDRPLRRITPFSIVDRHVLQQQLAEVRLTGVALEQEEASPGSACVAAAVVVDDCAVAAMSLSVPVTEYQPTRVAAAVRTAALGTARRLSLPT